MSQQNVELVRQIFAIADLDAASQSWSGEIEWVVAREHPEARTLNGREAVLGYLEEWQATLDDVQLEMDTFLDGGTSVVAVGAVRGTGGGSGAAVRVTIAFACTVADGELARVEEYLDPRDAMRAAGLAQSSGHA
jgi:ketosteroid isomerase-like protein